MSADLERGGRGQALSWGERSEHVLLDHDLARVDGPDKVSGRAVYTHDVRLPGMLYGRALLSPYPVAKPTVDLEPARALPGVRVALELADNRTDEGFVQRLGTPIAAVAATTPEIAADALRAIRVDWELGRWSISHEQALAEGAAALGEAGNLGSQRSSGDEDATIAALAECDAVVEASYAVPVQHHACLETHGVVVDYRGGEEATIYASTQATFSVSEEASKLLGLPQSKVTCIVQHMGGGFGAKFGLDLPGMIACKLAREARAPVHMLFGRWEEFVSAGNRSGARADVVLGGTKDGKLRALRAQVWRHGGVSEGAFARLPYIYSAETSAVQTASVLMHLDGSRAMRAPGHPQASFVMESAIDELAHELGLDPLEFRVANLGDPVYHRQLERAAREIGWYEHPNRRGPPSELPERAVGIGFAISTWGGGGRPGCQVDVRIERDGSVTASVGSQDLGTGTRTYVAGIVAEELGLPLEAVEARIGDSRLGNANGSGGSVTVGSLAPAVKHAAALARATFLTRAAEGLGGEAASLALRGGRLVAPGREIPWKEACALLGNEGVAERGTFQADLATNGTHGAQAAKVEVDTLTGELRVLKMVGVQDCGLPLNRLATRSQVNGGIIQALSYALFEERVLDPELGLALNAGFEEYRIAGSRDVPELVAILDEDDARNQVVGVGEPPVIPGAGAIANALFNACGVRLRELPLTRDKIVLALAERG
jgi:xanthine dehydrogenase YagR molybdenum-binding subunit